MIKQPDLKSSFSYRGKLFHINWYDIVNDNLPNIPWQQVYVVGDINGMAPVVHYGNGDADNLPGGKTEPGETVEQTLVREVDEEIKAKVVFWQPLGYQEVIDSDNKKSYQLRVYAKLVIEEEFINDPGGSVSGYSLVPIRDLNQHIKWGNVGDRLVDMVLRLKK